MKAFMNWYLDRVKAVHVVTDEAFENIVDKWYNS